MTHQFTLATSGDTILITVTDPAGNEYVQRLTLDDARRLWMGLRHVTGGMALKQALIAEMRGTPYTMPETREGALAAAETAFAPEEPELVYDDPNDEQILQLIRAGLEDVKAGRIYPIASLWDNFAADEPDADEADTRQMTPITGYEGDAK